MEEFSLVLLPMAGAFGLFIGIWLFVVVLLRQMSGMTRNLEVPTGQLMRESSWGSGSVNKVSMRNCLRVAEYERGWLLRVSRIFGNGKLWLPKHDVDIGPVRCGGPFSPDSVMLQCGRDRVRLDGKLADFVTADR